MYVLIVCNVYSYFYYVIQKIMEIIWYTSVSDWYDHYIINNSLWVPFEFRILLIGSAISLIYLILKKLVW